MFAFKTPKKVQDDLEEFGSTPKNYATNEKFFEGQGVEMADLKKGGDIWADAETQRNYDTGRNLVGRAKRKSRPGQFETPTRSQSSNFDGISEETRSDGKATIVASLEGTDRGAKRVKKKKKKKAKKNNNNQRAAPNNEFEDW